MMRLISHSLTGLILFLVVSPFSMSATNFQASLPFLIRTAHADISLAQAVDLVKRESGGRVLSSKQVNTAKGQLYLIKVLLPTGQVRTYRVSVADGSLQ